MNTNLSLGFYKSKEVCVYVLRVPHNGKHIKNICLYFNFRE